MLENVLESQENVQLAEKRQNRKSKTTRHKYESGDSKGEPNDSPEIPDRSGTSDLQGLRSGE